MTKYFILLLFILLPVTITAQTLPKLDKPSITGRKGFYLSASGGISNSKITTTYVDLDKEVYKGLGPLLDLKMGISLNPKWVLHLNYFKHSIASLKKENGRNNQLTNEKIVFDDNGFGFGATYYTKNDYFLTLSLIGSSPNLRNDYWGKLALSIGYYQIKLGKEWWISNCFALSIAGTFHSGFASKGDIDDFLLNGSSNRKEYKSINYGVLIGLTYHKNQK